MRQNQPNVLLIMSDQHAAFAAGCYGDPHVQTPHIDRLAAEGVAFDAAYCPSPLCVPSRHAFLAGRHCHHLGVWGLGDTMPSSTPTWPMALSAGGWETVMCGRMHLPWHDRNHGFERRLCGDAFTSVRNHFEDWTAPPPVLTVGRSVASARIGTGRHDIEDQEAEEAARGYLEGWAKGPRARPFAMCLGFYRPHFPFEAPAELAALYESLDEAPEGRPDDLPPVYQGLARHFGLFDVELTCGDVRRAIQMYYAMVTGVDQRVGRVLATLEAQGILDDTMVVYTSDHGEGLGRHGLWFKSSFYEESARVPLIVRYPARFPAGRRVSTPVSLLDWFPTCCDLAGIPPGPALDGHALTPMLEGHGADPGRPVFAEYAAYGIHTPMRMVRKERHKLVYAHGHSPLLYDLEADPGETRDLAHDSAHQAVVAALLDLALRDWDPNDVRRRVLENQAKRDFCVQAEEAIRQATGTAEFPWRR